MWVPIEALPRHELHTDGRFGRALRARPAQRAFPGRFGFSGVALRGVSLRGASPDGQVSGMAGWPVVRWRLVPPGSPIRWSVDCFLQVDQRQGVRYAFLTGLFVAQLSVQA